MATSDGSGEELSLAEVEADFFGLRLIRSDMLAIVGPGDRVSGVFAWLHLTPEEYELNEQRLAEMMFSEIRP
jgi:hypothetical protein